MSAKQVEAYPRFAGKGESDDLMATRRQDRRRRARTRVHWPVRIFRNSGKDAVDTTTRNLSSDGFYCLSKVAFLPGESVYCMLRLPAYDGADRTLALRCRIHILRVEAINGDGVFGIACRIEDYHFEHVDPVRVQ